MELTSCALPARPSTILGEQFMDSTFRSDCISRSSLEDVNSQRVTPDQVLDDVATQLADIEALPLAQRAEALADLHERLREQLEVADTSITTEQS